MTIIDSFPRQFGDFLAETGQDDAGYSETELDQQGNEYEVEITVEGLRNKRAEIVWNLLGDISRLSSDESRPAVTKTIATVTTIPASVTSEVTTIEGTTTAVTTIDGTTTTTTVPTSSTLTTPTTIPSRTQTVRKTVTVIAARPAGSVPVVRPGAKLLPP